MENEVYHYRITKLNGGSQKYGLCEVCKKECDVIFHQIEEKDYIDHNGKTSQTHTGCFDLFGHESCLINERREKTGFINEFQIL